MGAAFLILYWWSMPCHVRTALVQLQPSPRGTWPCPHNPPTPHASFLFALARGSDSGWTLNCSVCLSPLVFPPFVPVLVPQLQAPFTCKLCSSFVPVVTEHCAVSQVVWMYNGLPLTHPLHRPYNFYCRIVLNRNMNITLYYICLFLWEHTLTLSQNAL